MSNDIIQELEMDLAREKEKIFFQKYKHIIAVFIGIFLLVILVYQYIQNQNNQKHQVAADDYFLFKSFYDNIEQLTDVNLQSPTLNPDTIKNVSDYFAMSELIRFNNARQNDAPHKELLKITNDYIKNPYAKPQTIHDSILRLFDLSLRIDQGNLKALEPAFLEYLKHPFAFQYLGYEMLFLLAIDEKNADKANQYLKTLQDVSPPEALNKLKVYDTHPLIVPSKKVSSAQKKQMNNPIK